jgi:outer membrane murein-binding lipoprotein Lpp
MKRFLMLVAVAVVAGAMYVAAAPGSQQAKGPTAKQFKALKAQVASLSKTVKQLKTFAGIDLTLLTDCVKVAVPIDQFGDGVSATPTEGYEYSTTSTPNGADTALTTALDAASTSDPGALYITGGDSSCGTFVNGTALRHRAAKLGIQLPRASSHPFSVHEGR